MPANPTRNSRKTDVPLTNMTVGALQNEDFLMRDMAPMAPVEKTSDKYHVFNSGSWNRLEMEKRGPGEETKVAGWTLSDDSYECDRQSVGTDEDWFEEADVDDIVRKDIDSAEFLANQARLYGEELVAAAAFQPSVWTTDYDGAAAKNYAASQVLYWDNANSDPQADHMHLAGQVHGLTYGKQPQVMVAGYNVYTALVTNPSVRAAIQGHSFSGVKAVVDRLAAYFGVDKFLVAGASINDAKEGQSDSVSRIMTGDDLWCGYVNPKLGKRTYTSLRTFAFKGGGLSPDGVSARKYTEENKTRDVSAVDVFWDVKVVAADAAYFIDGLITP